MTHSPATAHCPWCNEPVVVAGRTTFAGHVQSCVDAPGSAKSAYRVEPYPSVREDELIKGHLDGIRRLGEMAAQYRTGSAIWHAAIQGIIERMEAIQALVAKGRP